MQLPATLPRKIQADWRKGLRTGIWIQQILRRSLPDLIMEFTKWNIGLVLSFYFAYCQENKGLKYGLLVVLKNIKPTFVSTMKYTNIKAKIFAPMLQMPVFSEEMKGFAIA